jgi:hypothetical protein
MTTTFRQDVVAGLVTILEAFATANPTLLREVHRARPSRYTGDLPFAYVGPRDEEGLHDSGTRTRTMQPSVVLVDRLTDNGETMDRFDILVDAMWDHLSASPHIVDGTIWSRLGGADDYEDIGGQTFAAFRFTYRDISIQEGRV